MIRFRPPRIALSLAVIAGIVDWSIDGRVRLTLPHPAIGAVLGFAGLVIMLRGWWLFRQAGVAIRPTAKTVRLVTTGIYRRTRNPMYLGLVLMMVGLAAGVGTLPFYAAAVAYLLVLDRVFCRFEERKLTSSFGDDYTAYLRRVRRWC